MHINIAYKRKNKFFLVAVGVGGESKNFNPPQKHNQIKPLYITTLGIANKKKCLD